MEYNISKESADKVFSRNIITHIPFNHNNISELHDYGGSIQKMFMAQVADTLNKVICEAIIRYADEQGATDLFLIDEEFIKSAIINEIQRRKELIK
jgi:hypothetical protein